MLIKSCSDLTLVGCVVEAGFYIDNSLTDSMMRARGKSSSSEPTAEQVRDLEQRNARLKEEISSLSSVLSEKPQRGRSGLAPVESDSSVLQMELKNASKQIEMYEKELGRLESKLRGGTVAERHLRLESLAREKKELIQKYRAELSALNRQGAELSKCFKVVTEKSDAEQELVRVNEEQRNLMEKIREAEARQDRRRKTSAKQQQYVKELLDKAASLGLNTNSFRARRKQQQSQDQVEDRTTQAYSQVLAQIKLCKKITNQVLKKTELLVEEKKKVSEEEAQATKLLAEKGEIEAALQAEIVELRAQLGRQKLRKGSKQAKTRGEKQKKKGGEKGQASRTEVKGRPSGKAIKFNDREQISSEGVRIVGFKVWVSEKQEICGLQATYSVKGERVEGTQHIRSEDGLAAASLELQEPDYLHSVAVGFSSQHYLDWLQLRSKEGRTMGFGVERPPAKAVLFAIREDEAPVGLVGAWEVTDSKWAYFSQVGFEVSVIN